MNDPIGFWADGGIHSNLKFSHFFSDLWNNMKNPCSYQNYFLMYDEIETKDQRRIDELFHHLNFPFNFPNFRLSDKELRIDIWKTTKLSRGILDTPS